MKAGISREAMMGKLKGEFSESESIELEKLITEIWDHSPFKEKA
jgi:hypothetical protein